MSELPKAYKILSAEKRLEMHREILQVLENVSSTSLQQINRQLMSVEAKRRLIKELCGGMVQGYDLDSLLIQIDGTIDNDIEFDAWT